MVCTAPTREAGTISRFWEAAERGDADTLATLATDDLEMAWPQSGERFRGRDNALAAMRTQPEMPTPAGALQLLGCGDVWVSMVPLRYGEEVHHYVGVFELRDGLIARTTEYFGAAFPAPEARARFTERD